MTTAAKPVPDKLPVLHRAAIELTPLTRADGTADPDRFRVAISSEEPVKQYFGAEILDHSRTAVDLSRFKRGLALRVVEDLDRGHYSGVQVGLVEEPELDEQARVLRGVVRFGRSAKAQEIKQDVQDKIRKFVSVSYRISKMVLESDDKDKGPTYRATRWQPQEVAIVSVPADVTVGFGRSDGADTEPVELTGAREADQEDTPMSGSAAAGAPTPTPPPAAAGARAAEPTPAAVTVVDIPGERKRVAGIYSLANQHGFKQEKVDEWINGDRSLESIKGEILDLKMRGAAPVVTPADGARQGQHAVDLSEKDQKEYSFCRAILAVADGNRDAAPFEYEVHDAIVAKRGESKRGGFYMPANLRVNPLAEQVRERILAALPPEIRDQFMSRAALDVQTATKGAELKFIEPGPFIEMLRNRMLVRALGARVLTGLQGDVAFPRQTGAGTFSWVPESPTADVASSNLLLNQLVLAPKIGQSTTSYSRKLLAQAVRDIDMLVREDLAAINALGIDLAAINGLGTSNQPTGILNTAGIGSVTVGANGGVPTYDHFVDLETQVAAANADVAAMAYLSTPQTRGRMKKSAQISATTGIPAWFMNEINGYGGNVSNQVPSNLTKGTSTTICHAILFGNWAEVLIGQWGELEVIADPYSQKKRGDIEVTTFIMADVGLRHAASMAAVKDALP